MEDYFDQYGHKSVAMQDLLKKYESNSEYYKCFDHYLNLAKEAINNDKSIIVCGPECSGKTYMQEKLKELLQEKNYEIFYGIQDYHYRNKSNGRHYSNNKFWIEEINENLISNVIEDYEFIRTTLVYNR